MSRSCYVDQSLSPLLEAGSDDGPQAGFLIGRLSPIRDWVVDVINASEDGEEVLRCEALASASRGSKAKGKPGGRGGGTHQVVLDRAALVEAAKEIVQTLPGGLGIVGLFLKLPEAAFADAVLEATAALRAVDDALEDEQDDDGVEMEASGCRADERILLLSCLRSGRTAGRRLAGAPGQATSAAPCELQFSDVWAGLTWVASLYTVRSGLLRPQTLAEMHGLAEAVLEHNVSLLRTARAAAGASVPSAAAPLQQALALDEAGAPTEAAVQLLLAGPRPACDSAVASPAGDGSCAPAAATAVAGCCSLTGGVSGRALVGRKEDFGIAVKLLKADLLRSLRERYSLLMDSLEEQRQSELQQQADAPGSRSHPLLAAARRSCSFALPRRVFLRGSRPGCSMLYSYYLLPGETERAAQQHVGRLIGCGAADVSIVAAEADTSTSRRPSDWTPGVEPLEAPSRPGKSSRGAQPVSAALPPLAVAGALLLLALAIAAGWMHLTGS